MLQYMVIYLSHEMSTFGFIAQISFKIHCTNRILYRVDVAHRELSRDTYFCIFISNTVATVWGKLVIFRSFL